jgi:hypothetical protein
MKLKKKILKYFEDQSEKMFGILLFIATVKSQIFYMLVIFICFV